MRRALGWLVATIYVMLGARRRVVRRLQAGDKLPVVIHNLPAAQLERLLAWLQTQGVLDKLWLTFDDAWTTIKASVPVLEKYKVKAKVFVAPGETLRGNVWTDVAIKAKVPAKVWRGWYTLGEPERYKELARWTAGKRIDRSLLDEEGVRLLAKHPLITIENHTWSHLSASHRPIEEVVDEIKRAQATLAEWTGRSPKWLAWPFGRGTSELDKQMAELGLKTVYTKQGYTIGPCRNMAIENVTLAENLGRILGAWPRVGATK